MAIPASGRTGGPAPPTRMLPPSRFLPCRVKTSARPLSAEARRCGRASRRHGRQSTVTATAQGAPGTRAKQVRRPRWANPCRSQDQPHFPLPRDLPRAASSAPRVPEVPNPPTRCSVTCKIERGASFAPRVALTPSGPGKGPRTDLRGGCPAGVRTLACRLLACPRVLRPRSPRRAASDHQPAPGR